MNCNHAVETTLIHWIWRLVRYRCRRDIGREGWWIFVLYTYEVTKTVLAVFYVVWEKRITNTQMSASHIGNTMRMWVGILRLTNASALLKNIARVAAMKYGGVEAARSGLYALWIVGGLVHSYIKSDITANLWTKPRDQPHRQAFVPERDNLFL